jgi:hypothetical protein
MRHAAAVSCVMCHNPENANDDRIARFEGSTVLAESVDFRVMIHKIHAGGLSPASWAASRRRRWPTRRRHRLRRTRTRARAAVRAQGPAPTRCRRRRAGRRAPAELTCTEPAGNDGDAYCTSPFWNVTQTFRLPPETSVCTSCHDATHVAAHAQVNTTIFGAEACATCHGPGKTYDVAVVHAR